MKLSIIVPIYNTDITKLQRCFESIKKIKLKSYECILVDDGSICSVSNYIKEYADNNREFTYIRKENGGVSSARNQGIHSASGEYICFVDSDDEIETEAFREFLMKNHDEDIIFTDLILVEGRKKSHWKVNDEADITYEKMVRRIIANACVNGPYCKFIKKTFLLQYKIEFNTEMVLGEDLVFFLDILIKKPSMYYWDVVSYYYHRDKQTGIDRMKRCLETYSNNQKIMYFKEIGCIDSGNFSESEKKDLKIKVDEICTKALFSAVLEMIALDIYSHEVEMNLIKTISLMTVKRVNMKTKISKRLVVGKHRNILWMLAQLRRVYIRIRYGK